MKQSNEGIVLSRRAFSESSLIVHVFTKTAGQQHFLFQGAKKKKGQVLFPLEWVQFSYYKRNDSALGKMSELEPMVPLNEIVQNPMKSSLAFFIAELLENLVQVNHHDEKLYTFITQEISWLNETNTLGNYLIWFLANLSKIEGFQPEVVSKNPTFFELQEGKFTNQTPRLPAYIQEPWLHWMVDALEMEKHHFLSLDIPKNERLEQLNAWLLYFEFHVHGMRKLKSLEVIRTVFYE